MSKIDNKINHANDNHDREVDRLNDRRDDFIRRRQLEIYEIDEEIRVETDVKKIRSLARKRDKAVSRIEKYEQWYDERIDHLEEMLEKRLDELKNL